MKFKLSLKDAHASYIEEFKGKESVSSNEEVVRKFVEAALKINDDKLIFGTEREQCNGECFASEPRFEVDIEDEQYFQLKKIYENYDFDQYDSEEEEVSKTVRCIINFFAESPDKISI